MSTTPKLGAPTPEAARPATPTNPATPTDSMESTEAESPNRGRILVVDDVPANVRLLAGVLRVAGFEVTTAGGGEDALRQLQRDLPDIVLLDVMMPDVDGFEVCRRIRARSESANLPVVMVTALNEQSARVAALEAGADDFLTKPVDEVEVLARVRNLLRAKRGRDELEHAYIELRRAESMRDNLTAMLVHDLRTPLTSMLMPLEMLRASNFDDEPQARHELVEVAHRSARRLLGMVNDLLDISKLEAGELHPMRAPAAAALVLEEALEQVSPLCAEGQLQARREIAPELPYLQVDADLLRRVLVNLLANAIRFAPAGSTLEVAVRTEAEFPPRTAQERWCGSAFTKLRDVLVFSVRDEGTGIARADQARIWDKFAQAEARGSGRRAATGLGLTFCKLAIEAHGGGIWVESEPGHGSTFIFAIPIQRGDAAS